MKVQLSMQVYIVKEYNITDPETIAAFERVHDRSDDPPTSEDWALWNHTRELASRDVLIKLRATGLTIGKTKAETTIS